MGWDARAIVERKRGLLGDATGISDGFVAYQDEQPLIGEEEALIFLL
jgi:hypothetical protein